MLGYNPELFNTSSGYIAFIIYSLILGLTLFAAAWVRNQFQGEYKDTLKELALASLFATIAISLYPLVMMVPAIQGLIGPFANLYILGVIWVCFQLEDFMDFLFFGAAWGLMGVLVQQPLITALKDIL